MTKDEIWFLEDPEKVVQALLKIGLTVCNPSCGRICAFTVKGEEAFLSFEDEAIEFLLMGNGISFYLSADSDIFVSMTINNFLSGTFDGFSQQSQKAFVERFSRTGLNYLVQNENKEEPTNQSIHLLGGQPDGNLLLQFAMALQALAQPHNVQETLSPEFVCVGDELVLEFDEAWGFLQKSYTGVLSTRKLRLISDLNNFLLSVSGEPFSRLYLSKAGLLEPEWDTIRLKAQTILKAFGWPNEPPPKNRGFVFVPG
jgi:hypothetical protein